jgi:hypothetical protein
MLAERFISTSTVDAIEVVEKAWVLAKCPQEALVSPTRFGELAQLFVK